MIKGGVVLLSGGVESTTLLHYLSRIQNITTLHAVFIDYNQRGAKRERECSESHCLSLGLSLFHLDLSSAGNSFRSEQVEKLHVPIPHRNLTILSLAFSYASMKNCQDLYIGLNKEDALKTYYPSNSKSFIEKFRELVSTLEPNIKVQTPFDKYTKPEIIKMGEQMGIDWEQTYSCMLGYDQHCGTCMQCKDRKRAFAEASVTESWRTYR